MQINHYDIRFNNVHYWPTPIKKIALIIIGIASVFLGLLLESGLFASIKISYQQTVTLEKKLTVYKKNAAQAQDDLKKLELLQQQENDLDLILPSKPDITKFIQSLSQIAEKNNMAFQTLEPMSEGMGDSYRTTPIHAVIVGSYRQLGQFINDISMQPRLINIADFSLQSNKDNGLLTFDVAIEVYSYDTKTGKEIKPSTLLPTQKFIFTRDPFLPSSNEIASDQCLLCNVSIHDLKMAGTMMVDGKLWAMVQSLSSMSAVKVGDKIGEEQISIIKITDHSVVLSDHFSLEINHS